MHSFYLPPGNLDLLTVTGAEAEKLLQGQVTCDVTAMPDPGFARGALCNNKGRVFATFILVRQGQVFYLVLSKGLGDVVKAALKKYLPFYKCELRDAPAGEVCFGARGIAIARALVGGAELPGDGQCASRDDGWTCTLSEAHAQYLVYSLSVPGAPAGVASGSLEDWLVCGMQSGQFPFVKGDEEQYTPQEIHLDRHGYVSFSKGCYTGQEIVARMHYRGKTKRQLFLLEAPATGLSPGEDTGEILDAHDVVLGATLKALRHENTLYALAVLPADLKESAPSHVKNRAGLQFSLRDF